MSRAQQQVGSMAALLRSVERLDDNKKYKEGPVAESTFGDHDIDRDAVLEAADDDEVGFADDEEDEDFDGDEDEEDEEDDEDETEELMEPSDE